VCTHTQVLLAEQLLEIAYTGADSGSRVDRSPVIGEANVVAREV
jgi:hypothetical protein